MRAEDYLDDQDVVELQQSPGAVKELDSFRFFFVSAFVLPGYQAVQREAKKRLESHLGSLEIPKELWQTVVNQATGDAERNPTKLAKKLGLTTSGVSPDGFNCPASKQGNECGECRACWDGSVENINYKKH